MGAVYGLGFTYSLHCSSFLGLPFRILNTKLVKPKKGTTMETIGRVEIIGSGLSRKLCEVYREATSDVVRAIGIGI